MNKIFNNKSILVTGAGGTVGSELIRQLLTNDMYSPDEVVGIDNNENSIFFLDQAYLDFENARFYVSDIKNLEQLKSIFQGIDIVFHTAALKHVILSERSPDQFIETNVVGIQNVILASKINNVEKVIFTSSDKAVNPTNVMGTSKLMGERLITAANSTKRGKGPIFASTRFGNVLGSSGSVVPIFHNQIINGGPVTITDLAMTRFIMSIKEAVRLVIDSSIKARGGEVFITKMPVVRIPDLAKAMIELLAPKYGFDLNKIEIKEIGQKPGEKIYEELMNNEEVRRAVELKDYFSVTPAFRSIYNDITYDYNDIQSSKVNKAYISEEETKLDVEEIKEILKENNLLIKPDHSISKTYQPGDREQIN
jgi:FlaA1/EpsC-like NDP-sugar epimerase